MEELKSGHAYIVSRDGTIYAWQVLKIHDHLVKRAICKEGWTEWTIVLLCDALRDYNRCQDPKKIPFK